MRPIEDRTKAKFPMSDHGTPTPPAGTLRVAMVSMSCYPQDPRVRRLAECLENRGIGVDVVCLAEGSQSTREQLEGVTVHRVQKKTTKASMLAYLQISHRFFRRAAACLAHIAQDQPFNLLHVHNLPDYLVYVGGPYQRRGIPVLLDLHDLMPDLFCTRWARSPLRCLRFVVDRVHRASCAKADHLLATSDGFRERLLARGVSPDRITLVLNSADHRIFGDELLPYQTHAGPPRLLYHGTVAERFGLHHLVDALALLRRDLGDVTLRIHGYYEADYRRQLEQRARDLHLDGSIHFGDYLSLERIRALIDEVDLGVVPYVSDAFMDRALSTKTFEYIASGLPVVTSRLPATAALFDATCVEYVHPGDADDLARGVRDLWADPQRRETMRVAAFAAYQSISWPVMEARYLQIVGDLTRTELVS